MLKRPVLLTLFVFGVASTAMAAWTDPAPATHVSYQIGCDSDSGRAIQVLDVASKRYFVRSSELQLFHRALSIAPVSVARSVPIQVFSFASQSQSDFHVRDDSGRCSTGSAVEMIGIALDRRQAASVVRARAGSERAAFRRLTGDLIEIRSSEAWSVRDLAGHSISVSSRKSESGPILDLASLPKGTYLLRVGSRTSPVTKF